MRGMLRWVLALAVLVLLAVAYFSLALNWSYSSGERAGWVQKFSNKGWVCKTWEGELSLVSMPGAAPETFRFTVRDPQVAQQLIQAMGQRVSLHYEELVGLPTSCWGETRHFVSGVTVSTEIPLGPGLIIPQGNQMPRPQQGQPAQGLSLPAGTARTEPASNSNDR